MKNSPEQKRGSIQRQIKTDVTHKKDTLLLYNQRVPPSHPPKNDHSPPPKKHLPKPRYPSKWLVYNCYAHVSQRAEGRAVLLQGVVYTAIGNTYERVPAVSLSQCVAFLYLLQP